MKLQNTFLMWKFIEKHHDKKLDAPSGTARAYGAEIAEVRAAMKQGHPE